MIFLLLMYFKSKLCFIDGLKSDFIRYIPQKMEWHLSLG